MIMITKEKNIVNKDQKYLKVFHIRVRSSHHLIDYMIKNKNHQEDLILRAELVKFNS